MLEVSRTIIESLQGIAWMLLVFFVVALMAYVGGAFGRDFRTPAVADTQNQTLN